MKIPSEDTHKAQKSLFPAILLIATIAGVWYLNDLTPMHSDDFNDKMKGLGWAAHVHQYLTWSGRVVADYLSPLLLYIPNKTLLALVQTAALFTLMFAVIRSAWAYGEDHAMRSEAGRWLAALVILLFLISMPDFGQVYMWVVGSANYLWPAVFYASFICCLLGYMRTRKLSAAAYPLAILAGCSNENMAVVMVAIAGMVLGWQWWCDRKPDGRVWAVFFLVLLGAAVLLGAPGNYARLDAGANDDWLALSWPQRIWLHLSDRISWNYYRSKLTYLLCFGLIAYRCLPSRRTALWHPGTRQPTAFGLSVLFALLSLAASLVMVASPTVMPRNMMGAFVLLVFAVAFGVRSLLEVPAWFRRLRRFVIFLTVVLVAMFAEVFPTYTSLAAQEKIRDHILASGAKKLTLPAYYMRWMVTASYRIDTYYNVGKMKRYFGLDTLKVIQPDFDYSVVSEPDQSANLTDGDNVTKHLWLRSEKYLTNTMVVVELDKTILDGRAPDAYAIEYTDIFGHTAHRGLQQPVQLDGRLFVHARLKKPRFLIKRYAVVYGG